MCLCTELAAIDLQPGNAWQVTLSCLVANLEENDKIKAELKPVKISEPKTPYHGPLDMDGLPDEGMLRSCLALGS